jgi:hypothetical protein
VGCCEQGKGTLKFHKMRIISGSANQLQLFKKDSALWIVISDFFYCAAVQAYSVNRYLLLISHT